MVDAVGYTNHKKNDLHCRDSHELEMKRIIRQVDNKAFMNITETVEIVGRFKRI